MAQISLEQANKLNEGGGKYFKVDQDGSKQVRFLWDRWEDAYRWVYSVHEINTTSSDGKKQFNTVDCARQEGEPASVCKYCTSGSSQVGRVVIPVFSIDDNKIQYWKRSTKWLTSNLKPVLDEVAHLPSIANQTFKIKRTGNGMDTTYSVLPVLNASDNRTKADFGELEDVYTVGIIKRYGEESQQGQALGQTQPSTQATRRTTEAF